GLSNSGVRSGGFIGGGNECHGSARLERGRNFPERSRNRWPPRRFLPRKPRSPAMPEAAPDKWTIHEAAHLLRRAGFGGSPDEIRKLHSLGRKAAVESMVEPAEPAGAFPVPDWA